MYEFNLVIPDDEDILIVHFDNQGARSLPMPYPSVEEYLRQSVPVFWSVVSLLSIDHLKFKSLTELGYLYVFEVQDNNYTGVYYKYE